MATGKRPNAGDLRRFLVVKRAKRDDDGLGDCNPHETIAPSAQACGRATVATTASLRTLAVTPSCGEQTHDKNVQPTTATTIAPKVTRVVKLKRNGGRIMQDCDVYIGRRWTIGGWDLPQSEWANPYSVRAVGSAAEAVRLYEHEHLPRHPELLAKVGSLKGLVLGCWCKKHANDPCHGDVLARLADAAPDRPLSGQR
ncbi:hypothetical protein pmac_cds_719 [Pandoravirus macleodensis]|uniref:DUF4326 domain-containing protein n=1 Tax=Pandoravirus macleodensis TaxID=2107707 RepID=A0A2U7UFZ7_9VIRU|nr:hypothetical protein pmac_cds_719 [Pandoravirus macleodensis]AVK77407.1 hypothetical protein pmac_cds_719 [Pandoravirus macleodensis]UMO80187.1 hypothetical protein [Pandoravirus aubagnensis]